MAWLLGRPVLSVIAAPAPSTRSAAVPSATARSILFHPPPNTFCSFLSLSSPAGGFSCYCCCPEVEGKARFFVGKDGD